MTTCAEVAEEMRQLIKERDDLKENEKENLKLIKHWYDYAYELEKALKDCAINSNNMCGVCKLHFDECETATANNGNEEFFTCPGARARIFFGGNMS